MERAWVGSKQNSNRSRRNSSSTATTSAEISRVCWMSAWEMPSTLPNRMWVRSMLLRVLETSTKPKAKNPVNTSPITVSSFTLDFCLTNPIAVTEPTPKTKAPSENGNPRA